MSRADRLGIEGKANERGSCNSLPQHPAWFSEPTTPKNHFVFPIRTPAPITYRPNRQINELKAALFEQGEGRGKRRGGKQLSGCADSGNGFQAGCNRQKQCLHPRSPLRRPLGRQVRRHCKIKAHRQLKGASRCRVSF